MIESNSEMTVTYPELVLQDFTFYGLDEHNRSIQWIEETAKRIGATIDTTATSRWSRHTDYFEITFTGRDSGIIYKICVGHSKRHAEILSRRMGEFEVDETNATAIMHAFDQLLSFNVEWYDFRKLEWEGICMSDIQSDSQAHWPGDGVVSAMFALSDDLNSCLEKSMLTLRREMREALVTYWFAQKTPINYNIQQIIAFVDGLKELQNASSEEEFSEIADRMAQSEILTNRQTGINEWEGEEE